MVKNLATALALAGFAIKIRQNHALVGFGKSKSGTTLVVSPEQQLVICVGSVNCLAKSLRSLLVETMCI